MRCMRGRCYTAVSYTHLDVYKRQEMNTNLYILEFDGDKNMNVTQQISLD